VDLREVIQDPRVAIEKGWSLLSYVGKAAVELGRYANDTYVKPAAAQLADPNFRGQVRDNVNNYVSSFSQTKASLFLSFFITFILLTRGFFNRVLVMEDHTVGIVTQTQHKQQVQVHLLLLYVILVWLLLIQQISKTMMISLARIYILLLKLVVSHLLQPLLILQKTIIDLQTQVLQAFVLELILLQEKSHLLILMMSGIIGRGT
jgi:hypothetical protein